MNVAFIRWIWTEHHLLVICSNTRILCPSPCRHQSHHCGPGQRGRLHSSNRGPQPTGDLARMWGSLPEWRTYQCVPVQTKRFQVSTTFYWCLLCPVVHILSTLSLNLFLGRPYMMHLTGLAWSIPTCSDDLQPWINTRTSFTVISDMLSLTCQIFM